MDDTIILIIRLMIAGILIGLNGFFVAAEFAIVKVRYTRIEQLAQEGNYFAKLSKKVITNIDAYLSASQLGITLTSLGLGWLGEPTVATLIEPFISGFNFTPTMTNTISFFIGFGFITSFHIVLGEQVPKLIAIQQAERITLFASGPLHFFYKLTYPAIWILNTVTLKLLKVLGFSPASETDSLVHTEAELRILVSKSHEQGELDETERELLDNVFDFTTRLAREVMIPRTDMICLFTNKSLKENLQIARETGHTRFPLCEEDKDHVIGIIHIKELFDIIYNNRNENITDIKRQITYVPQATSVTKLLKLLQKEHAQMAIVLDEYGGTAGLVTMEDILEELVGEIQDEFDDEKPTIEKIADNIWSIDASLLIDEVQEEFDLDIEPESLEDIDTIGGFVITNLAKNPELNDQIRINNYVLTITELDGFRINRLYVKKVNMDEEENDFFNKEKVG